MSPTYARSAYVSKSVSSTAMSEGTLDDMDPPFFAAWKKRMTAPVRAWRTYTPWPTLVLVGGVLSSPGSSPAPNMITGSVEAFTLKATGADQDWPSGAWLSVVL